MQNTQGQVKPIILRGADRTNDRSFTKLEFLLTRKRGQLVRRRRIRFYLINNGGSPLWLTWRSNKPRYTNTILVVAAESATLKKVLRKFKLLQVIKRRVEYRLRFSRTGYFP